MKSLGKSCSFAAAVALAAGLLPVGGLLAPEPAKACGGFFCSQAAPVNQAAEEILFVDNGDGSVTTVIEIQYVGPSEAFAWLLPVPGEPDIAVSSSYAFAQLRNATSPQYNLDVEIEGTCMSPPPEVALPDSPQQMAGAAVPNDGGGGVTVVSTGEVGPYEFHVISLDEELPEPADAALDWLTANDYEVTAIAAERLGPYLADGLNLLAVKLTKGNESGSIRPLSVTYTAQHPMIPIRPTAVAAEKDMGVQVYLAGQAQAIPLNYKSLVLNEALIDWFFWQRNYNEVVTAAADEAGGQGFVTESAGTSAEFDQAIFTQADQANWDQYSQQTFEDGFSAIEQAQWMYRGWDGWRDAIRASVTLPMSVSFDDFGRNPNVYRDMVQVDVQVFQTALWEDVVRPVIDAQELLSSQPYLTRMYSTMSPDEMNVDPVFSFNKDLMDVDRVHRAKQTIMCSPDIAQWQAPWVIELPQGGVITGEGSSLWPVPLDGAIPAALQIIEVGETGGGTVAIDNRQLVGTMLAEATGVDQDVATTPAVPQPGPDDGDRVPLGGDGSMDGDGDADADSPADSDDEAMATAPNAAPAADGDDDGGLFCSVRTPGTGGGSLSALVMLVVGLVLRRRTRT